MKGFPWYSTQAVAGERVADLPPSRRGRAADPARYLPAPELVDAVNTALLLGQPLLVTGEPGTGKTLLAASIAWQLGLGEALRFDVKSTSKARDLFYTYDALGRWQAVQSGVPDDGARAWIAYGPLGEAVLLANPRAAVEQWLPAEFAHDGPRRAVVLIDEVDKAPRDFPNDLLRELEDLVFAVAELPGAPRLSAPADLRPVVVFTSNSEKALPDAFLRRCVYHHLRFPDRARLVEILAAQLDAKGEGDPLLAAALDLFERLRADAAGLSKPPATAELVAWIVALRESVGPTGPGRGAPAFGELARRTLGALVKNRDDLAVARRILDEPAA
jgi:MoxR-like ATPase